MTLLEHYVLDYWFLIELEEYGSTDQRWLTANSNQSTNSNWLF